MFQRVSSIVYEMKGQKYVIVFAGCLLALISQEVLARSSAGEAKYRRLSVGKGFRNSRTSETLRTTPGLRSWSKRCTGT